MFTEHLDDGAGAKLACHHGIGIMLRGNEIREALTTDKIRQERRVRDAELAAEAESGRTRD